MFSSMVDEDLSFSFCSVGHSENFFCKYCQDGLPIVSDQCFSFFFYIIQKLIVVFYIIFSACCFISGNYHSGCCNFGCYGKGSIVGWIGIYIL